MFLNKLGYEVIQELFSRLEIQFKSTYNFFFLDNSKSLVKISKWNKMTQNAY